MGRQPLAPGASETDLRKQCIWILDRSSQCLGFRP